MISRPVPLPPVPRRLSLGLKVQLLFGGRRNQLAWAFFGLLLMFTPAFVAPSEVLTGPRFWRALTRTRGRIIRVEKTGYSEGKRRRAPRSQGHPIFAVHYVFEVEGIEYRGTSYTRFESSVRGQVEIEYAVGRPDISRIRGMRTAPYGWMRGCVLLFLIPLASRIVKGLILGARGINLLRRGLIAHGRLLSRRVLSRSKRATTFEMVFEFKARGRTWKVTAETDEPAPLEDEQAEPLLYLPGRPSYAVMLDHPPGSPRATRSGALEAHGAPVLTLLLPAIVVLLGVAAAASSLS